MTNRTQIKKRQQKKRNLKKDHTEEPFSRLLDIKQASIFLNLKISKLRTLVFHNEIPVIRINRLIRFHVDDLEDWINCMKSE